jgi:hypothetical protein
MDNITAYTSLASPPGLGYWLFLLTALQLEL